MQALTKASHHPQNDSDTAITHPQTDWNHRSSCLVSSQRSSLRQLRGQCGHSTQLASSSSTASAPSRTCSQTPTSTRTTRETPTSTPTRRETNTRCTLKGDREGESKQDDERSGLEDVGRVRRKMARIIESTIWNG